MGAFGDFMRDVVDVGGGGGACCRVVGVGEFACAFAGNPEECPDHGLGQQNFFYPGRTCEEVECGKEACCTFDDDQGVDVCTNAGINVFECVGGVFQGRGSTCFDRPCDIPVPEDEPEGCLTEPRTKPRAPGGYSWNTDLCQNAQFRMVLRSPDEWPARPEDREYTHVNYPEPVSNGPIRAFETLPGTEPCARHYGKVMISKTGYTRMIMCGQHVVGDAETNQASEGWAYLENDSIRPKGTGQSQRIDNGYATFAVGYRAPYWVEAWYHSYYPTCGALR